MEINKLIEIVKEKISKEIVLQGINVEDKSYLHKNHKNNSPNKFHIKITIISDELIRDNCNFNMKFIRGIVFVILM